LSVQSVAMRSAIALLGSALLLTCIASCSKLPSPEAPSAIAENSAITPLPAPSPQPPLLQSSQVSQAEPVEDVPLSKAFLEKLKQVPNERDRKQFAEAIQELNRMTRDYLKNKAILETLVQNQEKLLPILQSCGYKRDDGSSSFRGSDLHGSNFWKLSNQKQLVQLVCGMGAYNRSFVLFIASEISGKTQFKPLILTEFYKDESGKIQRRESDGTSGGRCPNSPFDRKGFYDETTKEFCVWGRYIGVGTCGTQGIYQLQNDKLVLQKFTANFVCDYHNGNNNHYKILYP